VSVDLTPTSEGFSYRVTHEGRTLFEGFVPGDQADALRCASWEAGRRLVWERHKWTMLFRVMEEQNLEAGRMFPLCTLGEQCPQGRRVRECPEQCCSPVCQAWEPATPPVSPARPRRSTRRKTRRV
jgi:hypothetical protein